MEVKKELQKQMEDMIHNEEPVKDIIIVVKENMKKNQISEHECVVMVSNHAFLSPFQCRDDDGKV